MKYFLKDNKPPTKKWKRVLVIASLVSLGLYLTFMGFYYATSEPSFCNSCHQMKPYVASWRNSPHKQVKCMYCHEFRGVYGKLESKARGLNDVYLQLTGQYSIIFEAEVFERNCASCHLGDYWNYPNTTRMSKQHKQFIRDNKSCVKCHKEMGHKLGLYVDKRFK